MTTSIEIFSKVSEYLDRRITLAELETWLAPRLPAYLSNPDSAAAEMAGAVELSLAELKAGVRSERSLRKFLA